MAEADPEPRTWPKAPLLAQLYDWEHDEFTADTELYISLAQRTGGPVLEAACGTGRVLDPLARRSFDVVGFDSSPEMLARAARRLEDVTKRATLIRSSLADPLPEGSFRLVIFALDALGLALETTAEQLDVLRRVSAAIAPDGVLALDLVHAAPLADQPEGVPVLQRSTFDHEIGATVTKWIVRRLFPATQVLELDCFYDLSWADGGFSRLEETINLHYFSRYEIELLLDRAGFRIEAIYGDYDLEGFDDDSPRMIVLANRQA